MFTRPFPRAASTVNLWVTSESGSDANRPNGPEGASHDCGPVPVRRAQNRTRSNTILLIASSMLCVCSVIRADGPTNNDQDTAIHVPTPPDVVAKMLAVAKVTADDLLYDLGCGDGRIVVAAAQNHGCRAVGYDIDSRKVQQSRENVRTSGVEQLVRIEQQDIFKLDLREASVITLYLLPEMNEQLIPQLQKLKNGSRIVAHEFEIEGIQHDRLITIKSQHDNVPHDIYLYTLPLKKKAAE